MAESSLPTLAPQGEEPGAGTDEKPFTEDNAEAALTGLLPLMERVRAGDETTRPAVIDALERVPCLAHALGDLVREAEDRLLHEATTNLLVRESRRRWLHEKRRALCGPNASPLECLLAERITLCLLYLHTLEASPEPDASIGLSELHQKRQDRAQRRLMSAIKTLAQVRRLQLPTVQVNVGGN